MTIEETAPPIELTERLRLYSRYLTVVAEQLDAVSEADGGRIAELEEERLTLEGDLAQPESDSAVEGIDELLSLSLQALKENVDVTRLLEERWAMLSNEALHSARTVARPTVSGGRYSEARAVESQLDRRL